MPEKTPIGILIPIQNGPTSGFFDQSFDTFTQLKTNIINLLQTLPGERRMQPTFGSRLWNLIFEQKDDILVQKISNTIKEDIRKWVPGISIKNINIKQNSDENSNEDYKLYVSIEFMINSTNQTDTIDLFLN